MHLRSKNPVTKAPCAVLKPLWDRLDESERSIIGGAFSSKRYRAGQALYLQGDDCRGLYCIDSGLVGLRRSDENGNSALLRLAKSGDMLGYRSVLKNSLHRNSAEVLTEARVYFVGRGKMRWLMERSAAIRDYLFDQTFQDLDRTESCCAELLTCGLKQRLLTVLLELHDAYGGNTDDDQYRFDLPIQKKDLAALLGTSPAALSRVIGTLERDGEVSFRGRRISIPRYAAEQHVMAAQQAALN